MAGTIGNKGDEALRLAENLQYRFHYFDILPLLIGRNREDLTVSLLLMEQHLDGIAVIGHKEPVALVLALRIHRNRLILQCVTDDRRNKLLLRLVRTVIVGAARDTYACAERPYRGAQQQITGRLACGVRGTGTERILGLAGRLPILQITVDFVRGDVEEENLRMCLARFDKALDAEDISMEEGNGILNAAVHMRLRGKVDDGIDPVPIQELRNEFIIHDVPLRKPDAVDHRIEEGLVGGVRQLVEHDHRIVGILLNVPQNKVGADEARPSCD